MKQILTLILVVAAGAVSDCAAVPPGWSPAENAALRYWMAFAQMTDSPISTEDAARMDAIVSGKAPWDEEKLGPLVDQNKTAIETMIRGTKLPYCEWGIEYNLGPDAPFVHLPKARALARLNRLYAERLASGGDYDGAIRATVAGLRFGQHMAQNASFFGALTAKLALVTQLEQTHQLAASGHLSSSQVATLRTATAGLPAGGFDWQSSALMETSAMRDAMLAIAHAADPKALYRNWLGDPVPENFHAPTEADISALDRVMSFYSKLLGMTPDEANSQLPALQKQISSLDSTAQALIPNPARMIAARAEIIAAQRATAETIGNR
jgi:hypothetical protein